jgi:bleomycin hydrolase
VISAPNKRHSSPRCGRQAFSGVLDAYLGPVPRVIHLYNGKTYTPKTFAEEVVKLEPRRITRSSCR